jgi:hypothetical protein
MDENSLVWNVFRRIPQISVSFAPFRMKLIQIFRANSHAISDRRKLPYISEFAQQPSDGSFALRKMVAGGLWVGSISAISF